MPPARAETLFQKDNVQKNRYVCSEKNQLELLGE